MQQLAIWHQTKQGLFIFASLELAAAYGMASIAINSGALWEYALAILLCIGGLRNSVRLMRNLFHGHKTATT